MLSSTPARRRLNVQGGSLLCAAGVWALFPRRARGMLIASTARLDVRRLTLDDAPFVLRLVNEPSWLQFIGDRGVRSLEDARAYLRTGPLETYARLGFGLFAVDLRESRSPIGMCGLLKREFLPDVDIGFALLPEFCSHGYALEAAQAVMAYARDSLALKRLTAIANRDNVASARLLEKLGMRCERMVMFPDEPDPLRLFERELNE